MRRTVDAIYEKGVIKPLEPLGLRESQKLTVTINTPESIATSTTAMIQADPAVVQDIAEGDEYLYDCYAR